MAGRGQAGCHVPALPSSPLLPAELSHRFPPESLTNTKPPQPQLQLGLGSAPNRALVALTAACPQITAADGPWPGVLLAEGGWAAALGARRCLLWHGAGAAGGSRSPARGWSSARCVLPSSLHRHRAGSEAAGSCCVTPLASFRGSDESVISDYKGGSSQLRWKVKLEV